MGIRVSGLRGKRLSVRVKVRAGVKVRVRVGKIENYKTKPKITNR